MSDLIDGLVMNWPVSLLLDERGGAHCAPYTNRDDHSAPPAVFMKCDEITDACEDLSGAKALAMAKKLGFVPSKA